MGSLVNLVFALDTEGMHFDFFHTVSTFDVGRSCFVIIPYDSSTEQLPRLAHRTLSTAYVVEPVSSKSRLESKAMTMIA